MRSMCGSAWCARLVLESSVFQPVPRRPYTFPFLLQGPGRDNSHAYCHEQPRGQGPSLLGVLAVPTSTLFALLVPMTAGGVTPSRLTIYLLWKNRVFYDGPGIPVTDLVRSGN